MIESLGWRVEGGVLRWTPSEPGFFDYGLLLTDSDGATASVSFQIEVLEALEEGCSCSHATARAPRSTLLAVFLGLVFVTARRRAGRIEA